MAKLKDSFSVFDDTTEPRADGGSRTEKLAEPPAAEPATERPARPARKPTRAETPTEMDKHTKARWRTLLQNSARKLARDREQLDESEQAWADTVAEARTLGVPANVILAAAADADVELPA